MSWIGNLVLELLPWSLRRAERTHFEQTTFFDARTRATRST
jgi:hypothetical protein